MKFVYACLSLMIIGSLSEAKNRQPNQVPEKMSISPEAATRIYTQIGTSKIETMAFEVFNLKAQDGRIVVTSDLDCKKNPKPYGQPKSDMCGVTIVKSFGWYADPSLQISVEAFVSKKGLGSTKAEDIEIRSVSFIKPDPTGLE